MGSLVLKRGTKPQRTPEQMAELAALDNMSDEDIDYSDIPPLTDEELAKFYPVNPRTPEQWEKYYRNCPPHVQKKYEQRRKIFGPII